MRFSWKSWVTLDGLTSSSTAWSARGYTGYKCFFYHTRVASTSAVLQHWPDWGRQHVDTKFLTLDKLSRLKAVGLAVSQQRI